MTPAEILNLPVESDDVPAKSVREYLVALLQALWIQKGSFDGKRPFGNSSWEFDLYETLSGLVPMTFDSDGYVEDIDSAKCDELIASAIRELGQSGRG